MSITLILTKHALQRMAEQGITAEQIKIAIQQGAKFKQTEGYLVKYSYLRVAYKIVREETYKIKTVFTE